MDETLRQQVTEYKPSDTVLERLRPIKTVILVGITAAGKDTIMRDILQETDEFKRVVTSTTRAPRENNGIMEVEGVNYYFLTIDQAREKIANEEYIEVADVHGRVNGSLVAEYERIASIGKVALSDIDYQGVLHFLSFGMENLSVYFVVPPSFDVWLERLAMRQGGALKRDEELIARLRSAHAELTEALNNPALIPVMNEDSAETARKIIEFTNNGAKPSDESITHAHEVIRELKESIARYLAELETEQ